MLLRTANISDTEEIARLHAESWRKHYRGIWTDAYLDNNLYEERLAVWLKRLQMPAGNQHITVAIDAGKVIGFACVYINEHPLFGSLLDNLHVYYTHQGSGIGKRLMTEAAHIIYNHAYETKFYLWVLEQNFAARKFYEKMGATNYETAEKENPDGSTSPTCRYTWLNLNNFMG